ncbi:hypothetical protein ACFYY8_11865 [Streptosporangium sp. NPDC001559]|uniref:hypothetical protein n=1 Tax=Streptosporangium sp. NPDC001559 TaxID=3366187 RepID=UPI0036E61E98
MGTTTTKNAQRPAVDWSLQPRGAVSATVQGTLALAAAATVGHAAGLSPLWGGVATAAGALGTVLVSAHHNHGPSALLYRLGCWIGAGSWWTYTLITTPWTQGAWASLGVGALVAGMTASIGRAAPRPASGRPSSALVLRSTARLGIEWEERIRRICRVAVTVTDVTTWPNGAGYDVFLTLPPSGATRNDLASRAESLATSADLPEGCSVEVLGVEGQGRSRVVLRVSTVNRLGQTVGYPADYSPRSILDPIVLGEYSNSDPAGVEVREEAGLIAGKRGSGKTTLLQDVSVALGRCRDNLVWHLDLNGGGLTQPWVDVWLDGRVRRCPIDWAAPNLAEGKVMLAAGIEIAKHRKASYRKLKRQHNTNLLPVSADLPQITIVIDEGAQAVGDRDLCKLIEELQNIGRNEAVNIILSSLRPTGDLVPVNMRKQSGVRIQMYGPDQEELSHMFGWTTGGKLSLEQLAGKGTGFLSFDGSTPRPFRAYNVLPAQIEEAALAVADIRPDLDVASAQAAGPAYAARYDRMRRVFTDRANNTDHDEEVPNLPAVPAAGAVERPAGRHLTMLPGGADASTWADPLTLIQRRPAPASMADAANWPDPRRPLRAEQIHPVGPGNGTQAAPENAAPIPEIIRRALGVFAAADAERLHSAELATALGLTQTDLADALRPYGITPLTQPFKRFGERGRGYALEDFQAAAGGHTPGSHPGVTGGSHPL